MLKEIEGYGDLIRDSDRFNAVLKFYRNKGDPLEFDTILQDPVPYVDESDGAMRIAWSAPKMHRSHIVFERDAVLARQADMLPGIYYTLLGMRTMGYRFVAIPPHLYAHSMHEVHGIERESVIRLEVFLMKIYPSPVAQQESVQATATAPVSSMSIREHNTVVAVASAAASGCA